MRKLCQMHIKATCPPKSCFQKRKSTKLNTVLSGLTVRNKCFLVSGPVHGATLLEALAQAWPFLAEANDRTAQ